MNKSLLIQVYLCIYYYYRLIRKLMLNYLGKIIFVYHINDHQLNNITLNYYMGYNLRKYNFGSFYVKMIGPSDTHHIVINGDLEHINSIKNIDVANNSPKRKKIILSNNNVPLNINMEVLDKYKVVSDYVGDIGIKNLGLILYYMGIKCTDVTIMEMFPFTKKTFNVNEIEIDHLYY